MHSIDMKVVLQTCYRQKEPLGRGYTVLAPEQTSFRSLLLASACRKYP